MTKTKVAKKIDNLSKLNKVNKNKGAKKFCHSIKLPDFYKTASKILNQLKNGKGSIKTLIYINQRTARWASRLIPALTNVSANYDQLFQLLEKLHVFEKNPQLDPYLAVFLASQILERKSSLPGESKPVLVINEYSEKMLKDGSISLKKIVPLPKYVRVNTLKITIEEVHAELQSLGLCYKEYSKKNTSCEEFLNIAENLSYEDYTIDYHIKDLLVFNSKHKIYQYKFYNSCCLIIQDKASCIPAFVSGVQPGMNVIYAYAAPGNKTTHLAALMKNEGIITAVERDEKRFETLCELVNAGNATCVKTICKDFLTLPFMETVQLILVDPSCSGSGSCFQDGVKTEERVKRLSNIQFTILKHSLSFPNVETVVYSTCSIYEKENEGVVEEALEKFGDKFELEDISKMLPGWKCHANDKYDFSAKCINTRSTEDYCEGFFVAKFIRKSDPMVDMSE